MQKLTFRSHLSVIALAVALGACAAHNGHRSTGQYADDLTTEARVKAALVEAPELRSTTIQVEVYQGTVQLSGFADSEAAAARAVEAARNVPGVQSVKNDIRIRTTPQ